MFLYILYVISSLQTKIHNSLLPMFEICTLQFLLLNNILFDYLTAYRQYAPPPPILNINCLQGELILIKQDQ